MADVSEIHDDRDVSASEQDGGSSREEISVPATTITTTATANANNNIEPSTPLADSASVSEREWYVFDPPISLR